MAPAVQLPALSGHLLLSVNEIGDREAYLKDQDDRSNDNGDDESVKEEECEHDDIFLRVNKYVC